MNVKICFKPCFLVLDAIFFFYGAHLNFPVSHAMSMPLSRVIPPPALGQSGE